MIPAFLLSPKALIGAGAAALFLALGAWGFTMRMQRDLARIERDRAIVDLGQERLALQGMKLAQDARLREAQIQAQAIGQRTNAVLVKLDASLPKTDEEARQWALNAINGGKP
jgi:hypothetical protein